MVVPNSVVNDAIVKWVCENRRFVCVCTYVNVGVHVYCMLVSWVHRSEDNLGGHFSSAFLPLSEI